MDNITTEIGFWWWAGWGKTWLWVVRTRTMCQTYKEVRYFRGRKELKKLKETVLYTYNKFCSHLQLPEIYQWSLNSQANSIRFYNWSEILFLDLAYQPSDPMYERFWSLEFTWGFIEEAGEVDRKAIDILHTRIGRQKNSEYWLLPKILETFNPNKWHVYDRFYMAHKKGTMPEYRTFIKALARDNSFIDQNYIKQLEKADDITRQRLLEGNFEYADDLLNLYKYAEISGAMNKEPSNGEKRYCSVDVARFGIDSIRIIVRDNLSIEKIFTYRKQTTIKTATDINKILKLHNIPRQYCVIDADGIWWWVVDALPWVVSFNGWLPARKPQKNFGNLKTQCAFILQEFVRDWKVSFKNLTNEEKDLLRQEMENMRVKDPDSDKLYLEKKEELKKRIQRSPDIYDAVMMRMIFEVFRREKVASETIEVDPRSLESLMSIK
jgi:hypothetical protein